MVVMVIGGDSGGGVMAVTNEHPCISKMNNTNIKITTHEPTYTISFMTRPFLGLNIKILPCALAAYT